MNPIGFRTPCKHTHDLPMELDKNNKNLFSIIRKQAIEWLKDRVWIDMPKIWITIIFNSLDNEEIVVLDL